MASDRIGPVPAALLGAVFPAVVLGIAASAPLVNDRFITPIDGRILSLAWWFVIPLGVSLAIWRSRRMGPGWAVGAFSAVAFHLSMALAGPDAALAEAALSVPRLVGAVASVAVPCGIGLLFGWTSIHRRPYRSDGVPHDRPASIGR